MKNLVVESVLCPTSLTQLFDALLHIGWWLDAGGQHTCWAVLNCKLVSLVHECHDQKQLNCIATNGQGVATNSQGIVTNSQRVATNSQGVATSSQGVATNSQGIATNSQNVATNSQGVATNSQGVASVTNSGPGNEIMKSRSSKDTSPSLRLNQVRESLLMMKMCPGQTQESSEKCERKSRWRQQPPLTSSYEPHQGLATRPQDIGCRDLYNLYYNCGKLGVLHTFLASG